MKHKEKISVYYKNINDARWWLQLTSTIDSLTLVYNNTVKYIDVKL